MFSSPLQFDLSEIHEPREGTWEIRLLGEDQALSSSSMPEPHLSGRDVEQLTLLGLSAPSLSLPLHSGPMSPAARLGSRQKGRGPSAQQHSPSLITECFALTINSFMLPLMI